MPASSLHTDRSRKSQRSGPTATKAIELLWAFTEPAQGRLRPDTARGIDGVLCLTVHVAQRRDSITTADWRDPIAAHVTTAMWSGATPSPNQPLILSTVASLTVRPRGQWTHLKVTLPNGVSGPVVTPATALDAGMRIADADATGITLLVAALRDGVPIHVRSPLPSMAGLKGGTYERPSLKLGTPLARPSLGTAV